MQSYFISFSMTRSCSLQKLLADLGVNVTTLAKHCSYLDSYCFKIGTPIGGKNFSTGGECPPPPLKETLHD